MIPNCWQITEIKTSVCEDASESKNVIHRTKETSSFPNHWASDLGSIGGNVLKCRAPWKCGSSWKYWFFSRWWFCSSQSEPECLQGKNTIITAYFRSAGCVNLGTKMSKRTHLTNSNKIFIINVWNVGIQSIHVTLGFLFTYDSQSDTH